MFKKWNCVINLCKKTYTQTSTIFDATGHNCTYLTCLVKILSKTLNMIICSAVRILTRWSGKAFIANKIIVIWVPRQTHHNLRRKVVLLASTWAGSGRSSWYGLITSLLQDTFFFACALSSFCFCWGCLLMLQLNLHLVLLMLLKLLLLLLGHDSWAWGKTCAFPPRQPSFASPTPISTD